MVICRRICATGLRAQSSHDLTATPLVAITEVAGQQMPLVAQLDGFVCGGMGVLCVERLAVLIGQGSAGTIAPETRIS